MAAHTKWLRARPGPLAFEVSSKSKTIRLTDRHGSTRTAVGIEASRDLLADVTAAGRRLWAANAALQEHEHAQFLAELGWPRVECARTLDQTVAPERKKPAPGASATTARTVRKAARIATGNLRDHVEAFAKEEQLWRAASRRGYRLDVAELAHARQERHRELDRVQRELGVDIRRSDDVKSKWLDQIGVGYSRTDDYGWSAPSSCDITNMAEEHAEAWARYEEAHHTLKRVQLLDGLFKRMDTNDRVHPVISVNSAATGRMAISNPGLQSLPVDLRHVILAEPGAELVSFDHSSAELKVLARLMGDPAFTKTVNDGDPYEELATFTGQPRSAEKWRLLAFVYGQSERSLAKKVGAEQSRATRAGIRKLFPEIVEWRDEQTHRAVRGEKITTLNGRPLPLMTPTERRQVGLAANRLVQGSARDAFGLAVRRTAAELGSDALWLPVHDELVVLAPAGRVDATARALESAMTIDLDDGLVLTGKAKVHGRRWGK